MKARYLLEILHNKEVNSDIQTLILHLNGHIRVDGTSQKYYVTCKYMATAESEDVLQQLLHTFLTNLTIWK